MRTRKYKGWKINCNTRRGYPCGSVIELTKTKAIEAAQEIMPWLTKKYIALIAYRLDNNVTI